MNDLTVVGPLRRVVSRHGVHVGQEGVEGQRGGSKPGYTHEGVEGAAGGKIKTKRPSAGLFHQKFEAAFKDNKYAHHVTHYDKDALKDMKALVLTESGNAGIAIKDHGDGRIEGTGLFNQGDPPGTGLALLEQAVKDHGINYLECYGERLRSMYESVGFGVSEAHDFNREYAAEDWDYDTFGEPKYYIMRIGD